MDAPLRPSKRKVRSMVNEGKIKALVAEGFSDRAIAAKLGISENFLQYLKTKFNITQMNELAEEERRTGEQRKKYTVSREELIRLQQNNLSDEEIARAIRRPVEQVARMRSYYDIPFPDGSQKPVFRRRGRGGRRVLNAVVVREQRRPEEKSIRVGNMEFIYSRLRQIRREKKIKQYELAAMIDTDPANLRKFERGHAMPRMVMLIKILDKLNINPNYLFLREEKRKYIHEVRPGQGAEGGGGYERGLSLSHGPALKAN